MNAALSRNLRLVWPLLLVLLFAAGLRLYRLESGASFHPDERHMIMVTQHIELNDMNPHSFAYGSLSYYLLWGTSRIASIFSERFTGYDGLFLVGRAICVTFGLLGVFLTYLLALKVYGDRSVALLAAVLLSFNVFHIQLSRFFTSDVILTTISTAALLAIVQVARTEGIKWIFISGLMFGLATATKISSVFLFPSFFIALVMREYRRADGPRWLSGVIGGCVAFGVVGVGMFALAEPYAFLDFKAFMHDTTEQTSMVRGEWRPPYTIQYAHTMPYIYPLQQMLLYTMGIPLALAAFAGVIAAGARQVKKINAGEAVLLCWVLVFFGMTGGFQVKFPRYLLPLYPQLFIFGAYFLICVGRALRPTDPVASGVTGAQPPVSLSLMRSAMPSMEFSRLRRFIPSPEMLARGLKLVLGGVVGLVLLSGAYYVYVRATDVTQHDLQFSAETKDDGEIFTRFQSSMDIAVDHEGNLYGVDLGDHSVHKYDANGKFVRKWGQKGEGPGEFNEPRGIAVDEQGMIYVMDTWNGRVQKFDPTGAFVQEFGRESGLFGPRAIAVRNGKVYVVDSGNGRIVVFDTNGTPLLNWGGKGSGKGELSEGVGIAVNAEGEVFVMDTGNDRIQKFSPTGAFLQALRVPGWDNQTLKEGYIECDENGDLLFVDTVSGSVLRYSQSKKLFTKIITDLNAPSGIAYRPGKIYIASRAMPAVLRKAIVQQ